MDSFSSQREHHLLILIFNQLNSIGWQVYGLRLKEVYGLRLREVCLRLFEFERGRRRSDAV
ncbi:hypothetical protein ACS0TY_029763 [Phlomoides rotata]